MGANLAINTADFDQQVLQSDVPVLVDFWAEWCGPCKAIGPSVEQIASEFDGRAKVYKLDVDNEREVAERYGVMSIPALFVFKNGEIVDKMVGAAPKDQIASMLTRNL